MPAITPSLTVDDRIPGLTPALAARLARLEIRRIRDALLHLPLRYEDETVVTLLRRARPGDAAQFVVTVDEARVETQPRRQLIVRVHDDSGEAILRFLHFYPSHTRELQPGARLRVFGELRSGFFGHELVHPRYRRMDDEVALPSHLTPVYPTTAGLSQIALRKVIARCLEQLARQPASADPLPAGLRGQHGFPDWYTALSILHQPPRELAAALERGDHPALARLRFEELLAQQISLRLAYRARRRQHAPPLPPAGETGYGTALLAGLPFALTGAQARAVRDISHDLAQPCPMHRLLQGDVGSGKTIVAALAMLQAVDNGWQAALMAPTEILAEQHYLKLCHWLAPLGLEVVWVAGSQKKRARQQALDRLASGEARLAVGTHALIEDPVLFPQLGLVVVDEQHRFGVKQRLALRGKTTAAQDSAAAQDGRTPAPVPAATPAEPAWVPHMLMMSATPIPRTLAMSFYADLDVSVLDELPPGRSPIITKLVHNDRRDEVIERVRAACLAGRQAYWVCPLIEESEALELQTAIDTCAYLTDALPELAVGLLHGRMKADEKSATMDAFARNALQLLVSTTVIEVGVDVPNATLMVIEHAERFGLAQLHQLRGRVGRGEHQSVCVLMYATPLSQTGKARLRILYEHQDGFEIARQDLLLRGPGEFIGARQSGVPLLRLADLERDAHWVAQARRSAEQLLQQDAAAARRLADWWLAGREGYLQA